MTHRTILPLLVSLALLPSCATGYRALPGGAFPNRSDTLEWRIEDRPEGAFAVAVRRHVMIPLNGSVDPEGLERGCRRDAVRIALEEAERRGWRRSPEVDERRIESGSGVVPGPYAYCLSSVTVSP